MIVVLFAVIGYRLVCVGATIPCHCSLHPQVDEEGAEAAAATAVRVLQCARKTKDFRVDHPFFVALVGKDDIPVFLGHVTEP